jgi:hypothetical protein
MAVPGHDARWVAETVSRHERSFASAMEECCLLAWKSVSLGLEECWVLLLQSEAVASSLPPGDQHHSTQGVLSVSVLLGDHILSVSEGRMVLRLRPQH